MLDSLPSVLWSLWITARVLFRNCFSPYEIIQQLLKHRKYHSRKQEIREVREVRETRSSYSLDIPNTSDSDHSSNAVRLQIRK